MKRNRKAKGVKDNTLHQDYINRGLIAYNGKWVRDKFYVNTGKFKIKVVT